MSVVLASLAAICFGAADFTGGRASRGSSVLGVLVLSQSVGVMGIVAIVAIQGTPFPGAADILWGMVAGLSGVMGLGALYRGLASASAAVVSPTAALVGASAPVVAGLLLGERPEVLGYLGIALAIPSILLLSVSAGKAEAADRRGLILGVVAGAGFGGFYILIAQTSDESGLWPLIGARLASIAGALLVAVWTGRRRAGRKVLDVSTDGRSPERPGPGEHSLLRVARPSRVAAILAGVLDMSANVFYLLASRLGLLMVSAVISSLYPAPTVLLARVIDKQRLTVLRTAGLVLALGGVALMSL